MSKMTLEERDKNFEEIGKPNRFTSENQPSPEAKSKGQKKSWEWKRLRQSIFEEIMDVKLPDGRTVNFWEQASKIIHQQLISDKSKLNSESKMKLLMKLMDMTPKTDNMNFESGDKDINKITLEFVDKVEKVDEKVEVKDENKQE